jgi:hypothetical protein
VECCRDNHNPTFRKTLVLPPRAWTNDMQARFAVYDKDVGAITEADLMGYVDVPVESLFAFHFDPAYRTLVFPLVHTDSSRTAALRKSKSTIALMPRFASPVRRWKSIDLVLMVYFGWCRFP